MRSAWKALAQLLSPPDRAAALDLDLATQRLCNHLVRGGQRVTIARAGGRVLWSDSAILEIAREFPLQLQSLLDHASTEPELLGRMQVLDARRREWRPASFRRTGQGDAACAYTDGAAIVPVQSTYALYLQARWPRAEARVKAGGEPVLFLARGGLVAALMPLAG